MCQALSEVLWIPTQIRLSLCRPLTPSSSLEQEADKERIIAERGKCCAKGTMGGLINTKEQVSFHLAGVKGR